MKHISVIAKIMKLSIIAKNGENRHRGGSINNGGEKYQQQRNGEEMKSAASKKMAWRRQ